MPSACPRRKSLALVGVRLIGPILLVVAFLLSPGGAQASTITVSGGCTLPDAIAAANTDVVAGGCTAGSGDDIIVLPAAVNLSYNASYDADGPNATPSITSTIVISGGVGGAVVARTGASDARLFHVAATGKLTLEKVTVQNGHLAFSDGGAIYNSGTLTLLESVILSNTAQFGGGLMNVGTATLTDTQIVSNTAQVDGGGIFSPFNSTISLTGSDLRANTAQFSGGGFYSDGGTVTLTNTQIVSNTAQSYNGGGFYNSGIATLTDTQIVSNTGQTGEGGGFYNDGTATLTGSGLLANTALYGGGFYNYTGGTVTITDTQIVSNTADLGGGFYNYDGGAATLTNTQIVSNTAQLEGGGFYNYDGGTTTLTGSDLLANTTQDYGGGFLNDGTATLTNTQIISNVANFGGGFANFSNGTATLTNAQIVSNTADLGGGFYNDTSGKATLRNTQISFNTAQDDGGGFYNYGTATLTGSDLFSNMAQFDGGGFYNYEDGTVTITDTQILSNTALDDGGGFYNENGGTTTLSGSDLLANTAEYGGGFLNYGTATLSNAQIGSNTAQQYGGGFYNTDGTATLTNTQIVSNTAHEEGGGFWNDGTATLTNTQIVSNTAQFDGGGFVNSNSGEVTLTGSDLLSNTAQFSGGGFYNTDDGTATLTQARLLGNKAGAGGALYHWSDGATTLAQSCIVDNSEVAVVYHSGPTVVAENNWWGASDGPSGVGGGAGDSVSSGVDFTPFLTTAVLGCPLRPVEIAFTKRVSPAGTLKPGQPLTYTLTLTNTGVLTAYNVYVADALPVGFILDNVAAAGAPHRLSGTTTIFTSTAPGQVATVTLRGHVDATLSDDLALTNSAVVTSPALAALNASVTANVVVPTLNWSSATYQSSEGSGAFNATLLLAPANPYAAVTVQVVITDSAAALAVAAVQNVTFPPGSGSQTVVIPPVDDGAILTRTVQLGLRAPSGAALGNTARATLIFAENDVAGLSVALRANVGQAQVGDTITYTARITNTGNVTFTTVAASDAVVGVVAGLAGALAPDATRTATLTYVVQPGDVGALVNTVTVTGIDSLSNEVVVADSVTVTVSEGITPKPQIFLPILKR